MKEIENAQISAEEKNLRNHLGTNDFEDIARFMAHAGLYDAAKNVIQRNQGLTADMACDAVQENEIRIVAFMTRRCYALAMEYLKVFMHYCEHGIKPQFLEKQQAQPQVNWWRTLYITDFALVALANELVQYYLKNHKMPCIEIVDELLIHGRAANNLLSDLEKRLLDCLQRQCKKNTAEDVLAEMQLDILEQLRANIRLLVYAQNDRILLLYPRYRLQLESFHEMEPNQWRFLSKKISAALTGADSSNVAYSWIVRVKKNNPAYQELLRIVSDRTVELGDFRTVLFKNDPDRMVYLRMYGSLEAPKVVGTVRVRRSLATGDLLIIPYMLQDKVTSEQQSVLFEIVQTYLSGFSSIIPQEDSVSRRRKQELCTLFLGKLIVEDWMSEIVKISAGKIQINDFGIDAEQLLGNFMVQRLDEESLDAYDARWNKAKEEALQLLQLPLLEESREKITEQLKEYLSQSKPVWALQGQCQDSQKELSEIELFLLNKILEDTVADVGYDAEKDAFDLKRDTTETSESDWMFRGGKKLAANDLFEKILETVPPKLKKQKLVLEYIAAGLVYMMDIGTVAMAPEQDEEGKKEDCDFANIHAGEQALFIKPSRYEKYMTVLRAISSVYKDDPDLILPEIKRFTRAAAENAQEGLDICKEFGGQMQPDEIADELYGFVGQLEKAGQNLKGWDFPLTDFGCRLNQKKMTAEDVWEVLKAQVDYLSIYRKASL